MGLHLFFAPSSHSLTLPPSSSSSSHNLLHFSPSPSSSSPSYKRKHTLFSPPAEALLKPPQLSLHQTSTLQTHDNNDPPPHIPKNGSTRPRSKKSIWINPRNPRAAELHRQSLSLLDLAESLNSCIPSQVHVSNVLSAGLGENPTEEEAVAVLNNMQTAETALLAFRYFQLRVKSEKTILYNVMMKVHRNSKDWEGAEKLLEEMIDRGPTPDNFTFSTIISCARWCSLPNKAIEWFERMPEFNCEPDKVTLSGMIDAYGRAGNIDMAMSLYDRARKEKWRLDVVTCSMVIKIYHHSGNFDGALNVYQEMKALGLQPNVVIYNTLLDGMGRAGRPWQAKSIYREMQSKGFLPNQRTYSALLHAYGRARYTVDALEVYREMKEKGMEFNVRLYNLLLSMCADIGYVDEAVEIFQEMEKSEALKPDEWTFLSMIKMFSCGGLVSEAERMLTKMTEAGFKPNLFVSTSLIQCYGKAKQIDDVVGTFDRLSELGIVPDERFCMCLLNVMTQSPKEEIGKLVRCVERADAELGYFVKLLVDEETDSGVFKQEAIKFLKTISQDVQRAYWNCMIDLCVKLNLLEKACELLETGITLEIYIDVQSKSPYQWSLHLRGLSLGTATTALQVWISELSEALESGEEMPPLLGIETGAGKNKYSENGLAAVIETQLKELNAPFHEQHGKSGWLLTTKAAAVSWLESRRSQELVAA